MYCCWPRFHPSLSDGKHHTFRWILNIDVCQGGKPWSSWSSPFVALFRHRLLTAVIRCITPIWREEELYDHATFRIWFPVTKGIISASKLRRIWKKVLLARAMIPAMLKLLKMTFIPFLLKSQRPQHLSWGRNSFSRLPQMVVLSPVSTIFVSIERAVALEHQISRSVQPVL
jgi:hypothetical protein